MFNCDSFYSQDREFVAQFDQFGEGADAVIGGDCLWDDRGPNAIFEPSQLNYLSRRLFVSREFFDVLSEPRHFQTHSVFV